MKDPLTDPHILKQLRALHASFADDNVTGSYAIEFHYRNGVAMKARVRGPEWDLRLAATS